jgi:type I restriction enzyme M protein
MAKTAEKVELSLQESVLEPYLSKLKAQGFDRIENLEVSDETQAAAIVWGSYQGVPTPRIFVWALAPGQWDKAKENEVQAISWGLTPADTPEDQYPQFGIAIDDEHTAFFDVSYPAHEIDRLPKLEEINEYKRIKADPTYKWSLKMYDRLMRGFDAFHEQVYQNVKDRVSSKNDIILEVAKILFLEAFRLNHEPADLEFQYQGKTLQLDQVFTVEYVRKQGDEAVKQIQAAFDQFKSHPDYVVTTDAGDAHEIFDEQTHLLLSKPKNYETLLDLIQNLGPVTYNNGKLKKDKGSLSDIAGDVLGRVFDVFLRGNFESKGGLGVYLTPAPVKQAMLSIAFHDIKEETPELLNATDQGLPVFRFCDPPAAVMALVLWPWGTFNGL